MQWSTQWLNAVVDAMVDVMVDVAMVDTMVDELPLRKKCCGTPLLPRRCQVRSRPRTDDLYNLFPLQFMI